MTRRTLTQEERQEANRIAFSEERDFKRACYAVRYGGFVDYAVSHVGFAHAWVFDQYGDKREIAAESLHNLAVY